MIDFEEEKTNKNGNYFVALVFYIVSRNSHLLAHCSVSISIGVIPILQTKESKFLWSRGIGQKCNISYAGEVLLWEKLQIIKGIKENKYAHHT